MSPGRALVGELIGASFAARLEGSADLVRSGVNSGDLVRLALLLEERYATELSAEDMSELQTLDRIDLLIERLEKAGRDSQERRLAGGRN